MINNMINNIKEYLLKLAKINKKFNEFDVRYTGDQPATKDDILNCFRLILGREPLAKEWEAHVKSSTGMPLEELVEKYVTSLEFSKRNFSVSDLNESPVELVELEDFKIFVSPDDNVCGELISNGQYEPPVTFHIRQLLSPGDFFLDIGANIGFFSCMASTIVGPKGRVLSVEPFEYNVKLLLANKNLNGLDNIDILPVAFSTQSGFAAYDSSGGNSGHIEDVNIDVQSLLNSTLVYTQTLDDALRYEERKIDLIKIDIEGAEYLALSSGVNRLLADKPAIITEFSEAFLSGVSKINPKDYLNLLLLDENYELFIMQADLSLLSCGRDIDKLIEIYRSYSDIDHIDILARRAA